MRNSNRLGDCRSARHCRCRSAGAGASALLGPALGFGLAAGVIGAGLAASTYPGYAYGPG